MIDRETEQESNDAFEGAFEEAIELREAGAFDVEAFRRRHPEHADRVLELLDVADAVAPPDAEASLAATPRGNRIGHYRLLELLGQGGQGQVYLAEDTHLKRRVALKLLTAGLTASGRARLRFAREAEAASKLEHPGICTVYEVGEDDGVPFIAMAFVAGKPLREAIDTARVKASTGSSVAQVDVDAGTSDDPAGEPRREERGPLEQHRVVRIVSLIEQAARALHVAHEKGLVHRDIKPGNIMVREDGLPVLLDFGLARDLEGEDPTLTATGDVMGTPAYMAPEQIAAKRVKIDRRTDIFSLGVVLFECLTLERPFDAPTREGLYQAILTKEPPDPRSLNPSLPRDLVAVLQTVLEKEPDRRYQTAEKLADDLAAVREGRPVSVKPISAVGRAIRWAKRKPAVAAVVALLAFGIPAVAGLGGFLAANWDHMRLGAEAEHQRTVHRLLAEGYLQLGEGSAEKARDAFERLLALDPDPGPEAVVGLGWTWQQLGEPRKAVALLERSSHRERSSVRRVLADALRRAGREPEAKALETRLDPAPNDATDCYVLGTRATLEGHAGDPAAYPRALALLQQAVFRSDDPPPTYFFALAHAAGHGRDQAFSRQIAEVIIDRWPQSSEAWFWAAFAVSPFDSERAEAWSRNAVRLRPDSASSYRRLGLALWRLRRFDEAFAAYREAIRLAPDEIVFHAELVVYLLESGDLEKARVAVHEMLQVRSDHPYARYGAAALMHRLGNVEEAVRHAREALRLPPSNQLPASAYYNLGVTLSNAGHSEEATEAHRRAIAIDPDHALARYAAANLLDRLGNVDEAVRHAREAVRLLPSDELSATFCYRLGIILADNGQPEDAVKAYRRAIELDPDFAEALNNLGRAYQKQGRYGEAIALFVRSMRADSKLIQPLINLGQIRRDQGRFEDALHLHRKAVRLSPGAADAYDALGTTLAAAGRLAEAAAKGEKAIELDPENASARCNLGITYYQQGRLDKALQALEKALELNPSGVPTLVCIGKTYFKKNRFDKAVNAFSQALEHDPQLEGVHHSLGMSLMRKGDLRGALEAFEEAVRLRDPPVAVNYHNLGQVYIGLKRLDKALDAFQNAVKEDPEFADAHSCIAFIHLRRGDLDGAVAAARTALSHDEDHVPAHRNIGSALMQKGEVEEAIDHFRRAVKGRPKSAACRADLGEALMERGDSLEAVKVLREAYRIGRDQPGDRARAARGIIRTELKMLRDVCKAVRSSIPDEIARAGETLRAVLAGWRIGEDELDRPERVRRLLRRLCGDPALSRLRDPQPDLTEKQNAAWRETWALVDRRLKEAGD